MFLCNNKFKEILRGNNIFLFPLPINLFSPLDTTKITLAQLEPFWHNLNEKPMYQHIIFASTKIH